MRRTTDDRGHPLPEGAPALGPKAERRVELGCTVAVLVLIGLTPLPFLLAMVGPRSLSDITVLSTVVLVPVALMAYIAMIIVLALRRRGRPAVGWPCPGCGYDLAGLRAEADGCTVCPECRGAWRGRARAQGPPG
ncbi:MAG: hypothetical protein JNJ48_04795 [Phycisphaerae bacterium]|nr:hypothetical protein [Phycisphaerae bacterium]